MKYLTFTFLFVFLTGCAGERFIPFIPSDKTNFENSSSIITVWYDDVPGYITWGPDGSFIVTRPEDIKKHEKECNCKAGGEFFVKRHNIEGGMSAVAHHFTKFLNSINAKSSITLAKDPMPLPTKEGFTHYKNHYEQDYIVEIQQPASILARSYTGRVLEVKTYNYSFVTDARIIRQSDSVVIWKGQCWAGGHYNDEMAISINDLFDKNNSKVKIAATKTHAKCADVLAGQYAGSKEWH